MSTVTLLNKNLKIGQQIADSCKIVWQLQNVLCKLLSKCEGAFEAWYWTSTVAEERAFLPRGSVLLSDKQTQKCLKHAAECQLGVLPPPSLLIFCLFFCLSCRLWYFVKVCIRKKKECIQEESVAQCARREWEEAVLFFWYCWGVRGRKKRNHGAEEDTDHQDHGWKEQTGECYPSTYVCMYVCMFLSIYLAASSLRALPVSTPLCSLLPRRSAAVMCAWI